MLPLTKILLPVDYSEACRSVALRGIELAELFGAEITVLRVLAPMSGAATGAGDTKATMLAAGRNKETIRLRRFVANQFRECRARVRFILREGDPASEILAEAAQSESDLIMMPTHGLNPFRLLLLGSVAARCLHGAGCPVWIGPHTPRAGTPDPAAHGHVVFAAALGSEMSRGLAWAAGLARAFHGKLTVLHLAPRADLPAAESSEGPWRCHPLQDGPLPAQGELAPRHILLETGDISRTVPLVAERLQADLLVLDRTPWDEAHLSIEGYAIIRSSSCPIVRL